MELPGWPGGDPPTIEKVSEVWKELGGEVDDVLKACTEAVNTVMGTWHGTAASKFDTVWKAFDQQQSTGVKELDTMSENLHKASETLQEAHDKYEHTVVITTAAVAVALAMSFFSFGASDAVAAGEIATGIAAIDAIFDALAAAIGTIATTIGVSAEVVAGAFTSGLIGFTVSVGEQTADSEWNEGKFTVDWWTAGEAGIFSIIGGLGAGKILGEEPSIPARMGVGAGVGAGENISQQIINDMRKGQADFSWRTLFASTIEEGLTGGLEGQYAKNHPSTDDSGSGDGGDDGGDSGSHGSASGTGDGEPGSLPPLKPAPEDPTVPNPSNGPHPDPDAPHPSPKPHPSPTPKSSGGQHEDPGTHQGTEGPPRHRADVTPDSPSKSSLPGGKHRAPQPS